MSLVESIAQAIATMEGFFNSGSLAQRNNNPGNLRSWGSAPIVGGYAQFATPEDGWNALYSQVNTNIGRGLNLYEFFGGKPGIYPGYAPSADQNHPIQYAQFVGQQAGINPAEPLNSLGGDTPNPTRPRPGKKRRG